MPRSMHACGLVALLVVVAWLVAACAQTSQPATTTAPIASVVGPAPTASTAAEPAVQAPASPDPSGTPAAADPADAASVASARIGAGAGGGGVSATLRACHADADCVAVPRAGCCHNGWKEAVAVSQADAYRDGNPCTKSPRPMCPMYMVRDPRVALCDAQTHLCTMVRP